MSNLVLSPIPFTTGWGGVEGGGGGLKIKVAQNGVKHGLVLEFLRSDEIFQNLVCELTSKQGSKQASLQTP